MPVSAIAILRAETAADHAMVDARFERFDLHDPGDYRRFLAAHAMALPPIERALATSGFLPPLRPRTPLIAADLAALGEAMPPPMVWREPATPAEAFGAAYVIEGSRLGGTLIARQVRDRPHTYLAATHLAGEWRGFLQTLDAAATDGAWIETAVATAKAVFARYAEAADHAAA